MANVSDRGGAGPTAEALAQLHREDLERYKRGVPAPIDVGDVRLLDSAAIAELGERYGRIEAAAAITAAATRQYANVKLTFASLPSGQKLHRVGDDSHLTADDIDFLNTRMLQQAHIAAVARETNIHRTIYRWTRELTGDRHARAMRLLAKIGDDGINRLLKIDKRERRKALARVLEDLKDDEEDEA